MKLPSLKRTFTPSWTYSKQMERTREPSAIGSLSSIGLLRPRNSALGLTAAEATVNVLPSSLCGSEAAPTITHLTEITSHCLTSSTDRAAFVKKVSREKTARNRPLLCLWQQSMTLALHPRNTWTSGIPVLTFPRTIKLLSFQLMSLSLSTAEVVLSSATYLGTTPNKSTLASLANVLTGYSKRMRTEIKFSRFLTTLNVCGEPRSQPLQLLAKEKL